MEESPVASSRTVSCKLNVDKLEESYKYVVIGGGIAGVSCVEQLSLLCSEDDILLISSSLLIKAITNVRKVTDTLEEFDVVEKPSSFIGETCPKVTVLHRDVTQLHSDKHEVVMKDRTVIYEKLCICTGGRPKMVVDDNPYVLGIRDTESVKEFQKKLKSARKIMVVGNGGIATELVYELENCEVIWAIKQASVTSTFVDPGAAEFLLSAISHRNEEDTPQPTKRWKYTVGDSSLSSDDKEGKRDSCRTGSALGPDWSVGLQMTGLSQKSHAIQVEYKVEVDRILTSAEYHGKKNKRDLLHDDWPIYVKLTNGKFYGCDFIVSATGVIPNTEIFMKNNQFDIAEDGGMKVGSNMQTSIADVYAAGDVCTTSWTPAPHWIQMRLWSQARQMGSYAAKCMAVDTRGEEVLMDFCFECFAHITRFFSYKVVLLGRFNAQNLKNDYELLLRVTKGKEYVKVVLQNGRMMGAILIGDTDLEETFENLILNKMDLTVYGEDLLNLEIDIEDYFD